MIDIQAIRDWEKQTHKSGFNGIIPSVKACGYIKALCDEIEWMRSDYKDLLHQACWIGQNSVVDSCATSEYAYAMRQLAEWGMFVIDKEHGRRVIGHWVPPEDSDE